MKPVLILDKDDVLVRFNDGFLQYYNRRYGTDHRWEQLSDYYFYKSFGFSRVHERKALEGFYKDPLFLAMPPVEGAQDGHALLATRYTLKIATARPAELADITLRQQSTLFPHVEDVFFTEIERKRKHVICKEQDAVAIIEDKRETVVACANAGIRAYLIDCPWNQGELPKNAVRVRGWSELTDLLMQGADS